MILPHLITGGHHGISCVDRLSPVVQYRKANEKTIPVSNHFGDHFPSPEMGVFLPSDKAPIGDGSMVYGVYRSFPQVFWVFPTCPTISALSRQVGFCSPLQPASFELRLAPGPVARRDPILGPQNQHIQHKNRTKPWLIVWCLILVGRDSLPRGSMYGIFTYIDP